MVREADPDDRRRVVVRLSPTRLAELIAVLEPMAASADSLLAGYKPAERAAITDYLGKAAAAASEATVRLRASTRGGFVNDTYSAPLGGATRGRLVFVTGGPRLSDERRAVRSGRQRADHHGAVRLAPVFEGAAGRGAAHQRPLHRALAGLPGRGRRGHHPLPPLPVFQPPRAGAPQRLPFPGRWRSPAASPT